VRLTKAGEYGVRCILYLAGNGHGKVVGRVKIAKSMGIPEQFLGKIAQQLSRSGFIEIIQGAKGGYRLLLSPDKLTLLDVVEAVTGEILLNDCLMSSESCFRSPGCAIHRVWEKARNQLRETLKEATFAKMLEEETCIIPLTSSEE
jgi:Rrf2 family protein